MLQRQLRDYVPRAVYARTCGVDKEFMTVFIIGAIRHGAATTTKCFAFITNLKCHKTTLNSDLGLARKKIFS